MVSYPSRPVRKALSCLVLLAIVAWIDYITGYEVSSFPLYLPPILLTLFYFGKWGGFLMSLATVVSWFIVDVQTGNHYTSEAIRYWNAFSRLLIYGLLVYVFSVYMESIAVHRQRIEAIRRLIPMCHGCGKIFWKDGTWKTPEEALEATSQEMAECPDCAPEPHRKELEA